MMTLAICRSASLFWSDGAVGMSDDPQCSSSHDYLAYPQSDPSGHFLFNTLNAEYFAQGIADAVALVARIKIVHRF